MLSIFIAILCAIGAISIAVFRAKHTASIRTRAETRYPDSEAKVASVIAQNPFPLPTWANRVLVSAVVFFVCLGTFNSVFFYAEAGYMYHVRTILGQEKMVDDVGYNMYLFGRITPWKKSMSIVAKAQYAGANEDDSSTGEGNTSASVILGPVRTIFLDQVDSQISATARFMLPNDEPSFLDIARQYRSPSNLLNTTLLPAFRETLQANAALMGAEDYFAGKRTEFNIDFEEQLKNGLYLVKRSEVLQYAPQNRGPASANASTGEEQTGFGDDAKVVFVVEKILDSSGVPIRKVQSFTALGIIVTESRITDVVPNAKFIDRMQLKQKASADRAIAREQRIQEEEQKLLAEAKGEREVAERKAASLVLQIEKTTDAETTKALAITKANQQKESAEIDKQRSVILLAKAKIDAQAVQVAADAESYKKRVIIQADNALAQKLEAEIKIQGVWAAAYAVRPVPTTVFGGGDDSHGSINEVQQFLRLKTVEAAQNLNYNRDIATQN